MTDIWEEHKKLYHYTDWDGLVGILEHKNLWATHYKFVNDSSECTLFGEKLISLLVPAVQEEYDKLRRQDSNTDPRARHARDPSSFARDFVDILVKDFTRVTGDEIYIASFCGEHKEPSYIDANGLLSQWRAYGVGGGFALVFDTETLWNRLKMDSERFQADGRHLSSCVYSDDEDVLKREFSEQIDTLTKNAKGFARLVLSGKIDEHDKEMLYRESLWPFVLCSSRYKHRGFKEENEVRLVVKPVPLPAAKDGITSIERQFRYKDGECVPYVSLFDPTSIEPAIEKIIVGPHREKRARAAALRAMLGNRQIEVTCSGIPFVG